MIESDTATSTPGTYNQRLYTAWNANFDVTSITNASGGAVVERFAADPYGVAVYLSSTWGTSSNPYNWVYVHQGMRLDVTTGIYQGKARDYSPTMQRWLEQDPAGYVDGLNRYEYEGNNPVNRLDPSGMDSQVSQAGPGRSLPGQPGRGIFDSGGNSGNGYSGPGLIQPLSVGEPGGGSVGPVRSLPGPKGPYHKPGSDGIGDPGTAGGSTGGYLGGVIRPLAGGNSGPRSITPLIAFLDALISYYQSSSGTRSASSGIHAAQAAGPNGGYYPLPGVGPFPITGGPIYYPPPLPPYNPNPAPGDPSPTLPPKLQNVNETALKVLEEIAEELGGRLISGVCAVSDTAGGAISYILFNPTEMGHEDIVQINPLPPTTAPSPGSP